MRANGKPAAPWRSSSASPPVTVESPIRALGHLCTDAHNPGGQLKKWGTLSRLVFAFSRASTMCVSSIRLGTHSPNRELFGLCLLVLLSAACTFDSSNLRSPVSQPRDGAVEYLAMPDLAPPEDIRPGTDDGMADSVAGRDAHGTEPSHVPSGYDGSVAALDGDLDGGASADLSVAHDLAAEAGSPVGSGGMGGGGSGGAGGGTSTGGVGGVGYLDAGEASFDVSSSEDVSGAVDGSHDTIATGDGADDVMDGPEGDVADAQEPDAPWAQTEVGETGASVDPDLVLWYRFDESGGITAFDSAMWGGVARNATLMTVGTGATAAFSTASQVGSGALALTPSIRSPGLSGAYVVMPSFAALAPDAVTIAVWVNLAANTSAQNWERIWDFGDSSTAPRWLNLTARSATSPYGPLFAMSASGHTTDGTARIVAPEALSENAWHHIAIVLPAGVPYTGVMYIDGVAVATNDAMTVHLGDIGANTNNWFGRSQFTSDPYFYGALDDFRVYKRALSQQEIAALIALH